jgi:hypothetical protein
MLGIVPELDDVVPTVLATQQTWLRSPAHAPHKFDGADSWHLSRPGYTTPR